MGKINNVLLLILISSSISIALYRITYHSYIEPESLRKSYDEGYQQAVLDYQLNITKSAESFVKARWEGEYIIYLQLEDFTEKAFEIFGIEWKQHIGLVWDLSFREATLFFIDKNSTLHIYYLD